MNNSNNIPATTDVLVVGGGPVGMTLSHALHELNVDHVTIEHRDTPAPNSRAAALHARTLENLDSVGVAEELVANGRRGAAFAVRNGDQLLLETPFADLETPFPFVLAIPQNSTEAILEEALSRKDRYIHRNHTLLSLNESFPGYVATVRDERSGALKSIRARYVVGCDGLHSQVRREAGIKFLGYDRPHNFALIEFDMDWTGPEGEISFFFSPAGMVAVSHLNGTTYRAVALVDDDAKTPDLEMVRTLLKERGPAASGAEITNLKMASVWRVQHRIAESFYRNGIALVGDAAHVHSPVGAQGLNTGIQDAFNLAWRFKEILHHGASEQIFSGYEKERKTVAEGVLQFTEQLHNISTIQSPDGISLRNAVLQDVGHNQLFKTWLARRLAQISSTYSTESESDGTTVGDRAPFSIERRQNLNWTVWVPITTPEEELDRLRAAGFFVLQTGDEVLLIRPDGHVAAVQAPGSASEISRDAIESLLSREG